MSVYDWIETRVPGGHCSAFGRLLDVAYNEEYGADTSDQSSLNIVYLLAYQPSPKGFAIFGVSDERYHIAGGNQRLPEAIAATLPDVRTGWRMTRDRANADGTVTLTFATPAGAVPVDADQVILTMPFSVLRTLDYAKAGFDDLKQTAITQLGGGPQREAAAPVHEPLLERERPVGDLQRRLLHRPRLPEHVGRDPRAGRRDGDHGQLQRRQRRRRLLAVDAVLERDAEPAGRRSTHARSCDSSRRSSPGSHSDGTARRRCRRRSWTRTCCARTRTGGSGSTPRSAGTRVSRRERSTSPASTARRTSRATWRGPRPRGPGPRSRSSTR